MSQSHRIPLKGSAEYDMLTGWRAVMGAGRKRNQSARAKTTYNRRQRRVQRNILFKKAEHHV